MLRQVSLQVNTENELQQIAKANGVRISISDCRAFNQKGMTMLLNLAGEPAAVQAALAAIRKARGVRQVCEGTTVEGSTPLLAVLDRPIICSAANDAAIICLRCPLDSANTTATWSFVVRGTTDLKTIVNKLEREGLQTNVEEISQMDQKNTLTNRQKQIVQTAVAKGFFDYPRKVSLTELSRLVGVKPSTLSEILRSAERHIMQNATELYDLAE